MDTIYNRIFLTHDTGMHPENSKRLLSLGQIVEREVLSGEEYLGLIHSNEYIEKVKAHCRKGQPMDPDTMTSEGSFNAAVHAVGATIMASDTGGFALVRPPGHHAYAHRASGFCLFNNVAIAAQRKVDEGQKVLILDFDGHLGDGTFHLFEETDRVMYWSTHQYPAFPGEGTPDQIGKKNGKGYTIPVILPPGSGDDIFRRAIETFLPFAKAFDPDIVAVSAGFDAHQYDLLLDLRLSLNSFHFIGNVLRTEFGNVFATLEGGYNIEHLPQCVESFLEGINGKELSNHEHITESFINVIQEYELYENQLIRNLSPFWDVKH